MQVKATQDERKRVLKDDGVATRTPVRPQGAAVQSNERASDEQGYECQEERQEEAAQDHEGKEGRQQGKEGGQVIRETPGPHAGPGVSAILARPVERSRAW